MTLAFADAAWWQMVDATIQALHTELGVTPTLQTVGGMCYRARELGWDVDQLRAWLATQTPSPPTPPVPQPPVPPVPPVPPAPPASADAIDLSLAMLANGSPDVRGWAIGTRITEFEIHHDGTITINFDKRNGPDAWPLVTGPEKPAPGEDGKIQYTLWAGCQIPFGERWYLAGSILGISRGPDDNYLQTGNIFETNVDDSGLGQLPKNWYYWAGEPLNKYQPAPGELVAWFVTAGVQRRSDTHLVAERSNIIVTPFQAGKFV